MKENQLGTNTNLLTMLKSSFLAGLSIHIMACCWFAVSCQNQVTFNSSSGGNTLCGQDSWAQYPSEYIVLFLHSLNTYDEVVRQFTIRTPLNRGHLSKQDTFSHPKCMHFNLYMN